MMEKVGQIAPIVAGRTKAKTLNKANPLYKITYESFNVNGSVESRGNV
jgi:hypothetical protein